MQKNVKVYRRGHRAPGRRMVRLALGLAAMAVAIPVGTLIAASGTAAASTQAGNGPTNPAWASVLAQVRAGKSPSIAFYGDSITAGYLSTSPGNNDFVSDFRNLVSGNLVPATPGYEFASDSLPAATAVTGEWNITPNTGYGFMNRGVGYGATNATGAYSYGPVEASSFNVMLNVASYTGAFGYQIDGGPVHSIGGSGTSATTVVNVPAGSLGLHTISFTTDNAGLIGPALVVGVEPVVSTPSLKVTRGGIGGMTSAQLSSGTAPFGGFNVAEDTATPTISVFMFGSNDWYYGISLSTFVSNLANMIQAARSEGSTPILMVPPTPENTSVGYSTMSYTAYYNAIASLGSTLGISVINLSQDLGPWSSTFMGDSLHPNNVGYQDIANAVFEALNG
jgi:lysophospholipase L1-like esterase